MDSRREQFRTAATSELNDVSIPEYLRAVRFSLEQGALDDAFTIVKQAIEHYQDNPYILSYYGYLQAIVGKRYQAGVETCKKAVEIMLQEASENGNRLPPVVYLNLGRAYIAAGRRKDAIESLEKGLKFDPKNVLRNELRGIGMRRKPVVPFLNRSNPINKYLGLMLSN